MDLSTEIVSFLSELDEAVIVCQKKGNSEKILFVNPAVSHFVGKKLAKEELELFSLKSIIHPEDLSLFKDFQQNLLKIGKKKVVQLKLVNKHRSSFLWAEIQGIVKKSVTGQQLVYYSIRDVDAQVISENLLQQSEQKHRLLFSRANDAIFMIKNLQIVECNEKTLAMFESPGYSGVSGEKLYRFMPDMQQDGSDSLLTFHYLIQSAIQGEPQFFYWIFKKFNGEQFDAEVSLNGFKLDEEDFVQVIVRDITARKKAEKEEMRAELAEKTNKKLQKEIEVRKKTEAELKFAQQYTASIINSSLDIIVACNKEGAITEFNKAASDKFEYVTEEIVGKNVSCLFNSPNDSLVMVAEVIKSGYFLGEIISKTKKGEKFSSYISASKLIDSKGETVGTVGIIKDISEIKKSELQLRESIEQKEVLLREVHHRVKNNLQVINSILKLQSMHITDESTVVALHDCQERIKSMAFIHENLYQSNDLARVNFSEYLRTLCTNLLFSYQVDPNKVKLIYKVDEVALSLDTGISCGLIVNELISNALKYAFIDKTAGEIIVSLSTFKDGHLLVVEDDGIGIPSTVNYKKTNSLGLQLVIGLVDQIDGEIELKKKKGTKFIINFKRK